MLAETTKAFFIVGSTAVGKTELAVRVAELSGAEIVNADTFQIYAGLVRLTAKPSAEQLARVHHHLVGYVPLTETYNVARYQAEAAKRLREIAARGKPAIVVGGSGLYVKALTHGLSTLPPAQAHLRTALEAEELPTLVTRLAHLDPRAAETIDLQNRRRVIRALEVMLTTGRPFSEYQTLWQAERDPIPGVLLQRPRAELLERIEKRAASFLEDDALDETRLALTAGFSVTAARMIGLAETRAFLAGEVTREDFVAKVTIATRQYAKRQLTWFRGESFRQALLLDSATDLETTARSIAESVAG